MLLLSYRYQSFSKYGFYWFSVKADTGDLHHVLWLYSSSGLKCSLCPAAPRSNYLLESFLMSVLFFHVQLSVQNCRQPFQTAFCKVKNSRENITSRTLHFCFSWMKLFRNGRAAVYSRTGSWVLLRTVIAKEVLTHSQISVQRWWGLLFLPGTCPLVCVLLALEVILSCKQKPVQIYSLKASWRRETPLDITTQHSIWVRQSELFSLFWTRWGFGRQSNAILSAINPSHLFQT